MRARGGRWLIAALALSAAARMPAQSASPLRLSRSGAGEIVARAGTAVSVAHTISNTSTKQITVSPTVAAPDGWHVVIGTESFSLAAEESDVTITSVAVPNEAAAGSYVIRVRYSVPPDTITAAKDSVIVHVLERRALELRIARAPPYVIAGDSYTAEAILRNSGNSTARFIIKAHSSVAKGVAVEPAFVTLAPGGSVSAKVSVQMRKGAARASVDVLVVEASHALDSAARQSVSTSVTVVQPPGYSGPTIVIPATLRLRQPTRGQTVARYELTGDGSSSPNGRLGFLARGKAGKSSLFGERDEYRMMLRGPSYNLRAGDNLYVLSPLLGGGQAGFGGAADFNGDWLTGSAYSQRFRFQDGNLSETGASVGVKGAGRNAPRLSLNALDRPKGSFAGRVGGLDGRVSPISDMLVDFDFARNLSGARGGARQVHASGRTPLQYDVGYTFGDSLFKGPAQGLTHTYAVFSGNPFGELKLIGSGRRFRYTPRDSSNRGHSEIYVTTNAGIAWGGALALNFSNTRQNLGDAATPLDEYERAWSLRAAFARDAGSVWTSAEFGRGHRVNPIGPSRYTSFSSGASLRFGRGNISAIADVYRGASISRGTSSYVNLGFESSLEITSSTRFFVTSFSSRTRGAGPGYHQIDSRLTHVLGNGSTIMLRARHTRQDAVTAPTIGYLEYSIPISIPTFRSSLSGRAIGTVVDRDTRAGIPGMLVRLGSQAAITDKMGRVYFNDLPPGSYRASIAQEAAKEGRIFVGDPNVRIDSAKRAPAKFNLAVERPARLLGTLREWQTVRTGIEGAADSLVAGDPVAGVSIALMNASDTVYRVTDDAGAFEFTELSRGTWILQVLTEPPALKMFSPALLVVVLEPGEARELELRLIPKRKEVRILEPTPPPH